MPTNKLKHPVFLAFVSALIIMCAAIACAQDYGTGPAALPGVMDCKRAHKLIVLRPNPKYPSVAKVNYLQGQVLLEVRTKI